MDNNESVWLDAQAPAMVRALLMPEILGNVFMWIHHDTEGMWEVLDGDGDVDHHYGRDGVLMRCGLVNRLWWEEAMRYLWAECPFQQSFDFMQNHFIRGMSSLDPSHKQFLANLVETAVMNTVDEIDAEEYDSYLRGLALPKLHTLTLYVDMGCTHVPRVEKNVVRRLLIDPRFEVKPFIYALTQGEMDTFLDQVATVFPCLEEVEFQDMVMAHPGAVERFAKRLPRLQSTENMTSYVIP